MSYTLYRNDGISYPYPLVIVKDYIQVSESIVVESPQNVASKNINRRSKDTSKSKSSGELDAFETYAGGAFPVSSESKQKNMVWIMTFVEGDASASSVSKQTTKKLKPSTKKLSKKYCREKKHLKKIRKLQLQCLNKKKKKKNNRDYYAQKNGKFLATKRVNNCIKVVKKKKKVVKKPATQAQKNLVAGLKKQNKVKKKVVKKPATQSKKDLFAGLKKQKKQKKMKKKVKKDKSGKKDRIY